MTEHPFEDVSGTREEILEATFRSLREYGYSELTVDKIGSNFAKSKSLIYHHYDGKDELVLECLEYLLETYEGAVTDIDDDPRGCLETVLEYVFAVDSADRQERAATLFELRAQAVHDEAYRDHFTRSDQQFEDTLAGIIHAGIEDGEFQACNPDAVATTLVAIMTGTSLRRSTTTDLPVAAIREELEAYLEARVYR
ncbi:TetR/AcrR family transcriptional regulator [Natronolimnobius sp. AArcel1]|uniref:TetR/AcrR family transcriptional regulator n=1 Tax=Natronolimnobius sp. AArcel1 TaxID=1679093 RepID=UPI0013EDFA4B|nr:TetR/AcrR family transcriptional regulator [Natronolimnobius sp. AArcel1]NGM69534.1 TetR/AcrR family transcriptional regulator [Natronolimnobius sp. AArcel1]